MNPLALISLLPTVMKVIDLVKGLMAGGVSVNSIANILQNEDVKSIFTTLGGVLFPNVKPEMQASAALAVTASPDYVKRFQNAANLLLDPSPNLDVDGHFGAASKAACEKLQKMLGMELVDGFPGDKTMAAAFDALLKHDAAAKTAATTVPVHA